MYRHLSMPTSCHGSLSTRLSSRTVAGFKNSLVMMQFYTQYARRKAFTLIELLVVISIISLLLAILIPALQGARKSARAAYCLSMLRQWHIASTLYINDNNSASPAASKSIMRDRQQAGEITANDWYQTFWGKLLTDARYILRSNPDKAAQTKLVCPRYRDTGNGPYTNWDGSLPAYWPRYFDDSYSMLWCDAQPNGHDYTYVVYRTELIRSPANLMLLADHHPLTPQAQPDLHLSPQWDATNGWHGGMSSYRYSPPAVSGVHSGSNNFVAYDGHAASLSYAAIREKNLDKEIP